jgi:hypothetical protein
LGIVHEAVMIHSEYSSLENPLCNESAYAIHYGPDFVLIEQIFNDDQYIDKNFAEPPKKPIRPVISEKKFKADVFFSQDLTDTTNKLGFQNLLWLLELFPWKPYAVIEGCSKTSDYANCWSASNKIIEVFASLQQHLKLTKKVASKKEIAEIAKGKFASGAHWLGD